MALDSWLPVGHVLPSGERSRLPVAEGRNWQIVETEDLGRTLIVQPELASRWTDSGVLEPGHMQSFKFGDRLLHAISSRRNVLLCPVSQSRSPNTKSEAMAFATAMKETRKRDPDSGFQDAVYVQRFSRLLPTYSISPKESDDVVLGFWLTGGVPVSVRAGRRIEQMLSWLGPEALGEIVRAAGLATVNSEAVRDKGDVQEDAVSTITSEGRTGQTGNFQLPGRPDLEAFFNEHIIDIVTHRERYKALGIDFPAAVVLHGPPGCGKTFAVEQLVDFLGWPSFQVDASSIASPYIHETSKKIAGLFDSAIKSAPSVLVIDEMDAFLSDRQSGSGHHRVEEVAEFLRRIPEATKNDVLIIAMTNRLDMIDPAILRRGRFDHVIQVNYASVAEVHALLEKFLGDVPSEPDVDPVGLAKTLAGRPLSDVAFVVREGARLAARAGRAKLDAASLAAALRSTPARNRADEGHRIGFR
jgi:cell division protease FtsH